MKKVKVKIKNLSFFDIGFIKWSCIFFTLFLISVWPNFANWTVKTHWAWFLFASLILAIKPIISVFKK